MTLLLWFLRICRLKKRLGRAYYLLNGGTNGFRSPTWHSNARASYMNSRTMKQSVWSCWILWIESSSIMSVRFTSLHFSWVHQCVILLSFVIRIILIVGLICFWRMGLSHCSLDATQKSSAMRCRLISSTIKICAIWIFMVANWQYLWCSEVLTISQPSKLVTAGSKCL